MQESVHNHVVVCLTPGVAWHGYVCVSLAGNSLVGASNAGVCSTLLNVDLSFVVRR